MWESYFKKAILELRKKEAFDKYTDGKMCNKTSFKKNGYS